MVVSKAVDGVLDVFDVVLGVLITIGLLWPSELQDPSVICNMPPPASRGAMVVAEVVDAWRSSAGGDGSKSCAGTVKLQAR